MMTPAQLRAFDGMVLVLLLEVEAGNHEEALVMCQKLRGFYEELQLSGKVQSVIMTGGA